MSLFVLLHLYLYFNVEISAHISYKYSKRLQHSWSKDFKHCAGKRQSPIAIKSSYCVSLPLPALEMNGYHDYLPRPNGLMNSGHSVEVGINKKKTGKRLPYIFGALLDSEYELEGLHFHWGKKNHRGSEHRLIGVRFPMEMHIVHRNVKYRDMSEALEHEDGVVVLAIFFQLQEDSNKMLGPLVKSLPKVQWLIDVEVPMNVSITLASFLPKDIDVYYTYKGSLTTPPCSEVVTWILFSTPVQISFKQMEKFRMLSNGEDVLADNFRQVQEIGHRKIYVRRLAGFANDPAMLNLNISQLDWYWR